MKRAALLAVLLVASAAPLAAHPHVFINDRMTVLFDGGTLKGITFTWTFDEVFSNMILVDYNPQRAAVLSAAQSSAIKAGAFDNLVNYHYFVAFWIDGKPVKKFAIEQFRASVADKRSLVYSFFVPLNVPVDPSQKTVFVTVYDDTYYVAFDILHTDAVTVKSDESVSCTLAVQKTKVKAEWPGQYMPDQLVISFKEKQ
ncbi:MAG TPA: DUF1007 family protein [Spirochaetia bacterium]